MEGSKFKKNALDKVPCWIKLVDVPHSYWSKDGLNSIVMIVGKPLKFIGATLHFEPMKYACEQVELAYNAPRPDFAWVTIINCDGEDEKIKVEIQYP